jgi:ubiquinone/menaquinone biosynthesis C-methylase UbiE
MEGLDSQYDAIAQKFSRETMIYNDKSRQAFYSVLDFEMAGKSVLDVGCGDGYDLARLQHQGAACYGIDSSTAMVKLAQRTVPDAHIACARMEEMPYAANSFDIVLSKYVMQTSGNLPKVIEEMTRVLRPNGIIVYLAVHPLRQFLEKKKHPKDFFLQEIVASCFFQGAVTAYEPTHTMQEYLNPIFLKKLRLLHFSEHADFPCAEQIDGDTYPCFFVVKAQKNE